VPSTPQEKGKGEPAKRKKKEEGTFAENRLMSFARGRGGKKRRGRSSEKKKKGKRAAAVIDFLLAPRERKEMEGNEKKGKKERGRVPC